MVNESCLYLPEKLVHGSFRTSSLGGRLLNLLLLRMPPHTYQLYAATGLPVELTAGDWVNAFPEEEQPYQAISRAARSLCDLEVTLAGATAPIPVFDRMSLPAGEGRLVVVFNSGFLYGCISDE